MSLARRAARLATVAAGVPAIAAALGLWTTAVFNHALQRPSQFSSESPTVWLEMGFRSMVTPAVFILGVLIAISLVRFAVRLVSLSRRVDSLFTASRSRTKELSSRLNFDNPAVAAQAAVAVGIVAVALVTWRYWSVLDAAATFMSTEASLQRILPTLRPPRSDASSFRLALDVIIVGFSVALLKIMRMRQRQTVRAGGGALAMLSALFLVTVLMVEAPYRLFWHAEFERVMADAGERCYAIGETATEYLLFCPDAKAPRDRVVPRDAAGIRRTGIRESIFTPPEASH
jgi:hypothetical protein